MNAEDPHPALRKSALSLLDRHGGLARMRFPNGRAMDRAVWEDMCRSGWLQLPLAELCVIAHAMGMRLAPEPLAVAAVCNGILPDAARDAALTGERIFLLAWQESAASLQGHGAIRPDKGRLTGRKIRVPMAMEADAFLVTLENGIGLVERDAPGVCLEVVSPEGGGHFATIMLDAAPATILSEDASLAVETLILFNASYLLGVAQGAMSLAFGELTEKQPKPPGWMNARVQTELTRSVIEAAVADLSKNAPGNKATVSRAKIRAVDAAMAVTRTALHAVGQTAPSNFLDLMRFHRTALALAPLYGGAMEHRSRWAGTRPSSQEGGSSSRTTMPSSSGRGAR